MPSYLKTTTILLLCIERKKQNRRGNYAKESMAISSWDDY
ncbi:hypothetical protein EMIT019CA3_10128 [Bacillus pseudomycoides]